MKSFRVTVSTPVMLMCVFQVAFLVIYLYLNILTIGSDLGVGLTILGLHIFCSFCLLAGLYFKNNIVLNLRYWFFWFALLMCWLSLRVVIDLGDLYFLKQITIATTGGILFFFLLGQGLSLCYQAGIARLCAPRFFIYVWLGCFLAVLCLIYFLSNRMHESYFIVTGINGAYQRPGNFLSMIYMLSSYAYMSKLSVLISQLSKVGLKTFILYSTIFFLYTILALGLSQMIGSNSATGVILILYAITFMMSVLSIKEKWACMSVFSLKQIYFLARIGMLGIVVFALFIFMFLTFSEFDIGRLGVLGFGSGEVTSLSSRVEILSETFQLQAGYSPIFGDMNVASNVTGDEGKTLHNLFPYVLANLGAIGLCLMLLMLLGLVWANVISTRGGASNITFLGSYKVYVVLGMIFFANIATGISWPVLWFSLGLLGGGIVQIVPKRKNRLALLL